MISENRFERFLSDALRKERLRLGWTQPELAERCGYTRHHVCRIETGRHRPSTKLCSAMATALGLSFGDLLRQAATSQ